MLQGGKGWNSQSSKVKGIPQQEASGSNSVALPRIHKRGEDETLGEINPETFHFLHGVALRMILAFIQVEKVQKQRLNLRNLDKECESYVKDFIPGFSTFDL